MHCREEEGPGSQLWGQVCTACSSAHSDCPRLLHWYANNMASSSCGFLLLPGIRNCFLSVECSLCAEHCKPSVGQEMRLRATDALLLTCFPHDRCSDSTPLQQDCCHEEAIQSPELNHMLSEKGQSACRVARSCTHMHHSCCKVGAGLLHCAQQEKPVMQLLLHVVRGLRQSWSGLSRPQHQHS